MPGAEAQLSGLIFAVLLIDPRHVVRMANPAAEDLLGQSAKRMNGREMSAIFTFEDDRVAKRFAAGEARLVARSTVIHSGGKTIGVNLTVSPLATDEGWRVVTLSEGGPEDGDSGRSGSALHAPAVLAHEIKNPLSAIRGAGQLLARKVAPEDRPLAQMITDEVDRIARLVDRMQRLGSETPDPVAPTNLHETIRSAIAAIRAASPEGPEITEEFDPSLPQVLANSEGLQQVLINLITNAQEACRSAKAPKVTVHTRFAGGLTFSALLPGRSIALPVEISVRDNGVGVDPALRDQIFEPFVSSKTSGQGLGLALVRKLLRDMNGRIAHERHERAGLTVFRIRLPVAK